MAGSSIRWIPRCCNKIKSPPACIASVSQGGLAQLNTPLGGRPYNTFVNTGASTIDIATVGVFAVALFTITNPLGSTALFASMTADLDVAGQRTTARQSALAITIILLVVLWAGHYLLKFFGIDIAALETAGGIIVLGLGLSMLHNQKSPQSHSKEEHAAATEKDSIAVVPIAIPIVAGPGAITAVLVHSGDLGGHLLTMTALSGVCVGFGGLFWLCFYYAGRISLLVGVNGIAVVTRIMGMVLAAIACTMIANGLKQLLPGLA